MQHLVAAESGEELVMVHAMKDWYLRSDFKTGKPAAGRLQFVWLFGIIGGFVLLLACINFMNLSTARSEKRAREVGIRKAIGSMRQQLIRQFLAESVLVACISAIISIILAYLSIGWFNQLAAKEIHILWDQPLFWISIAGFTLLTGLLAGSYPAFYLSSFQPVKVLKGTFRGRQVCIGTAQGFGGSTVHRLHRAYHRHYRSVAPDPARTQQAHRLCTRRTDTGLHQYTGTARPLSMCCAMTC